MKHNIYQFKKSQNGFTIIELMIATAVFSVVLLIATVAVIMVTNSYVKGDIEAETQDTTRSILTAITQDIQFNQASSISPGTYDGTRYGYFCAGNDIYFYQINEAIGSQDTSGTPVYHDLLEFTGNCPLDLAGAASYKTDLGLPNGGGNASHELLAQNMRLGELLITPITIAGNQAFTVSLTVAYGSTSLLIANAIHPSVNSTYYTYSCPPGSLGGQFCAVSSLTTTVTPRIQ